MWPLPEVTAYVRIPRGAYLFQAPNAQAPAVQLNFQEGETRVAEVAEVRGQWLQVWLGPTEDLTFRCHPQLGTYPLGVGMWVRADEVATVATMPIEVRYDDLTSVFLMPGVPVYWTGVSGPKGPLYRINANGIQLQLSLPEQRVGRGYFPTLEVGQPKPMTRPRPVVMVDNQPIPGDMFVEVSSAKTARGTIAEAGNTCIRMVVWATDEMATTQPLPRRADSNRTFAEGEQTETVEIGEGVLLHWRDGTEAGTTTGAFAVEGRGDGEQWCFGVLAADTDPPLVLCMSG